MLYHCDTMAPVIVIVFIMSIASIAHGYGDAERLYDDLINGYNSLIRPVGNNSDRLTVKLGLKLSQLIDVVSVFIHHA